MLSEKSWKPDAVLRLLLGLFASMSVGALVIHFVAPTEAMGSNERRFFSFTIGTLSFHGMVLFLVSLFLREHEAGWAWAFGFASPNLNRTLLLAVMVSIVAVPVAWYLGQASARIMIKFQVEPVAQQAVQTLQTTVSLGYKIFFGLAAVVLAPFTEEMLFRGILYPAVKQLGFRGLALWGTSLLFAATHANLMTFVPLTFLAVILTLLYERTDNLLAPILTHSLFNAANFLLLVNEPHASQLVN